MQQHLLPVHGDRPALDIPYAGSRSIVASTAEDCVRVTAIEVLIRSQLPHVSDTIQDAERTGTSRECINVRDSTDPDVAPGGVKRVSPRIGPAVATLCRILPLERRRKTLSGPVRVRAGVLGTDPHNRTPRQPWRNLPLPPVTEEIRRVRGTV